MDTQPTVSLLRPAAAGAPPAPGVPPDCLTDLALDHVFTVVTAGRAEYHLEDYLWAPLTDPAEVVHRQEAMRDVERPEVSGPVRDFADGMRVVRTARSRSAGYRHPVQRRTTLLEAAEAYIRVVRQFSERLTSAAPASEGLRGLAAHLQGLVGSAAFATLADDAARTRAALDGVTYRLQVSNDRVRVSKATGYEHDYAAEIAAVFERFRHGSTRTHVTRAPEQAEMNHVEEGIAERVETLCPGPFALLADFATTHSDFMDPGVRTADRELQFLLAAIEFARRLEASGLPTCWPEVAADGYELVDAYDPALVVGRPGETVVRNDLELHGEERVALVTGPNQGGKTTFARMVGSTAYLTSLGFRAPARRARLPLADRVLTHFGRAERLADLRGALEDDLVRLREILGAATPRSLVVLNEVFTSTSVADAVQLSRWTLDRLLASGCTCVRVTFLTELAATPGVVSHVSQVNPDDPTIRTFRVVRQPAGGPTWAETLAIAQGLDHDSLKRRLAR